MQTSSQCMGVWAMIYIPFTFMISMGESQEYLLIPQDQLKWEK